MSFFPPQLKIKLVAGDTYRGQFIYEAGDPPNGIPLMPVDLTGCIGRSTVRVGGGGGVIATGAVSLGGILGTIQVVYPAGSFVEITTPIVYDMDVELTFANGDVQTLLLGTIDVYPGVTRVGTS